MIKPKHLQAGDTVAFVSLSRGIIGEPAFIHKFYIAKERLEKDYHLNVVTMKNSLRGSEYLYRNPEARAEDLMDAFSDNRISAVFNCIGGDDTIRILPYVDLNILKSNPKIFTGFSDTTTNHFMMHSAGIVSYYGLAVMNNLAEYIAINEYTRKEMDAILFSPVPQHNILCSSYTSSSEYKIKWREENVHKETPTWKNSGYEIILGEGKVQGHLMGGCVDVFPELLGTSLWPSIEEWKGAILLLENSEMNMPPEVLAWFLRNLYVQGVISVINGIIVGKPPILDKYEKYKEVFIDIIGNECKRPDLPIIYNVNVGHTYPIGVFPLGLQYEIDCKAKTLTLLEPGTS